MISSSLLDLSLQGMTLWYSYTNIRKSGIKFWKFNSVMYDWLANTAQNLNLKRMDFIMKFYHLTLFSCVLKGFINLS